LDERPIPQCHVPDDAATVMRNSSLWLERIAWVFRLAAVPAADQSLWSPQRIAAYAAARKAADAPEALLRIPRLALEVPVYGDTSDLNLDRGAGHIPGTAGLVEDGNIGIAAHRDGFFRKLKDVELDMDIFLEHGGRTLRYRIVEISLVTPEEAAVLAPTGRPSVTLVTCYPFYFVGSAPQRFIVRGELDETQTVNQHPHRKLQRRET
jgi:sortase A